MDLRPEDELLLCCARTSLRARRRRGWRPAPGRDGLDLCLQSGVSSRAGASSLQKLEVGLPGKGAGTGHGSSPEPFFVVADIMCFGRRNCSNCWHLFESHDVPAVPYKGPVLAASIYGDID